ncbi:hypothetical protein C8R45DRAFT_1210953 [Mycena sanguinolenta]|nr:hypothetical protein C8R45DRAFT_1210953 [Mycena sanguinolenta]
MSLALLIAVIAGGVVFVVVLAITVVYVHRRSKRQMKEGAFDKTAFSGAAVVALAAPRPPLGLYQSSPRPDPEAQRHDLVGREVRQQEAAYMQLMTDLQRPASRTDSAALPNQTPRMMVQRDPVSSPLAAYPVATAPAPPPPVALPPPAASLRPPQLQRGFSIRSRDSTASEYSVASAPRDAQEITYKPFALNLPTIPASPATPKWPASPGTYVWPKRQRASQIREALAPETYAMRWKIDSESVEPPAPTPVARAVPSTPTGLAFAPSTSTGLVFAPPVKLVSSRAATGPAPQDPDSPNSATTAHLYYANASPATTSPTRNPTRPF